MQRFVTLDTPLAGLRTVRRTRLGDARGHLCRLFCAEELDAVGWDKPIAQINQTRTAARGTMRGLHFQRPPHAEKKLVMCLRGTVWDVAVDVRAGSPTFLHWHAVELSGDNDLAFLIPEGFAHGFQALTDDVEMLYLHSAAYAREAEGGLNPLDPRLALPWPLPPGEMSERDRAHPLLTPDFQGVPL
ncbi:dTDP-4-dehydrorhamnose 3,5-epimerase family protein [Azospirillum sp.]|uniref:dTDP-4-dehydrorhamnose 3,5-epimerase family protein n=1 Tax=Azospirillum sp. TaxID=34012 RepID=UPI003D757268